MWSYIKSTLMIYAKLSESVKLWALSNYSCDYSEIAEILSYIKQADFLRKAQIAALEHYWYTRLVLKTPHIQDIYKNYHEEVDLLEALGIPSSNRDVTSIAFKGGGIEAVFEKIRNDDAFVKKHKLEGLRETLSLSYPSYILALAMGAGKTILISSIISTEFALALEHPENNFVKNALVFAPGKTILGALREISFTPYEKILPPRLHKQFLTNVKFTYTRDGQKDIPIIRGSSFNVIVTNTEKIRIRKEYITKGLVGKLFRSGKEDEAKELVANQRLEIITSLPNLAVFSDEAHHTYGQALGEELKRVRQTIDHIQEKTNLIVVINTTGTPYYQKKVLRDVIYWYGLSQGINDGILKDVKGNVIAYQMVGDEQFIKEVVNDFVKTYWDVNIFDGASAKLAIYFPQIEDIKHFKPIVEKTLLSLGKDPAVAVIDVHSKSPSDITDLFDNRINDPSVPYRIFLLVNKGTEGWNCPSLFSTALARQLKGSNNFCLQAATRCLRQVPFNKHKAKIYISEANVKLLDNQLKETYGESLNDLNKQTQETQSVRLIVKKMEIPKISLMKKVYKVIQKKIIADIDDLDFKTKDIERKTLRKRIYDLSSIDTKRKVLRLIGEHEVEIEEDFMDLYSLSANLSETYRLDAMKLLEKLRVIYPEGEIPESHILKIKEKLESLISNYEIKEETIEEALAILRVEGFNKDKDGNYYTEIKVNKTKLDELIIYWEKTGSPEFGFHYDPYNFDSRPEKGFFLDILGVLGEDPDDVKDIYFTGGLTSRDKTDFVFEYKKTDGSWHPYSPDFLILKRDGRMIIAEVKGEPFMDEAKELAMKEIEGLNPDKIKYELLETDRDGLKYGEFEKIKKLIYERA